MEQREINLLIGKGFEIKTFFLGRAIVWRTKKMTLGKLIALSDVFLNMEINEYEEALDLQDHKKVIIEQHIAVNKNARKAAKVMAIAVTDNKLLQKLLVGHFLRNITPADLNDFARKLLQQADYKTFMISIVLMNGNRITKAATIENKQA